MEDGMTSPRDKEFARRIAGSFHGDSGRRSSSKLAARTASVEFIEWFWMLEQQHTNRAVANAVRLERIELRRARRKRASPTADQ
jgi:hypothetical protein